MNALGCVAYPFGIRVFALLIRMVDVGTVQTTSSQGKGEEEEVKGGEDHVTDSEISNTHRHCFVPVFEVDESK